MNIGNQAKSIIDSIDLLILEKCNNLSILKSCEKIKISHHTLTQHLNKLIKIGLIKIDIENKKRIKKIIIITEKGKLLLKLILKK